MRYALCILLCGLILQGCSPLGAAAGIGSKIGVASAEERGLSGNIKDTQIDAEIQHLWFQHNLEMFSNLSIVVYDKRVLLTGTVTTGQQRLDAVRLAWKVEEVREVINEIHVGAPPGIQQSAKDTLIVNQLEAELLFDGDVRTINYQFNVHEGVVYMIGVAQNQQELEAVVDTARNIANVQKVISHVQVKPAVQQSMEVEW